MAQCTATTRSGKQCRQPAILGANVCRMHGGAAPQVRAKAEKRIQRQHAEEAVIRFGLRRDIEPHEALLEAVQRAAYVVGEVEQILSSIEKDKLIRGVTKAVRAPNGDTIETRAARHVWLEVLEDWHDRLVRAASEAIRCGVAERQVELAEQQAQQLAQIVSSILTDLGHDLTEPRVRETVRLRLIEGGQAA